MRVWRYFTNQLVKFMITGLDCWPRCPRSEHREPVAVEVFSDPYTRFPHVVIVCERGQDQETTSEFVQINQ
jgi:hypothetical protein